MKSRERIRKILSLNAPKGEPGFWMGNPNSTSINGLCDYFNKKNLEEIRILLGDELFWVPADSGFSNEQGWTVFAGWKDVFSEISGIHELESVSWPKVEDADFSSIVKELSQAGDRYRLSGMWSQFFHDVSDLMGMENYFVAMYEKPEIVHALTKKIVDLYCEANAKFFENAKGEIDAYFFGNDLGSQRSTLVSPSMFQEFIYPYMKQLIDVAKSYNLHVVIHSCGAIVSLLPYFIELGVNAIHPVQIKAVGMDLESLSPYRSDLAFIGGIDTQDLLRNGSHEEIISEINRIYSILGPNIIISPSHESILPDVPPKNIEIISRTVFSKRGITT